MTVVSPPIFDPSAFLELAERTEYETWFLEAAYKIAEQELFYTWPDAVVYPVDKSKAQFVTYARMNIVEGDWRPGFLNAGAPLVFVSTFKILDMLMEWILEKNGYAPTFRFEQKKQRLVEATTFPPLIESRFWLKERLTGLYCTLEPLRGTIIHNKHFTSEDGAIRVSSSKKNVIGPTVEISAANLRKLVQTIVSIFRYVEGTWNLDDFRERTLRHNLDELVALHGKPQLGQQFPFHTQVRVYSTDSKPFHIDPTAIAADLAAHYVNQDCSFDLRVLLIRDGTVVDVYLFPWALFSNLSSSWGNGIDPEQYRTAIPEDINPGHLCGAAS